MAENDRSSSFFTGDVPSRTPSPSLSAFPQWMPRTPSPSSPSSVACFVRSCAGLGRPIFANHSLCAEYVQLKPLLVVITFILKATGTYKDGSLEKDAGCSSRLAFSSCAELTPSRFSRHLRLHRLQPERFNITLLSRHVLGRHARRSQALQADAEGELLPPADELQR